MNGGTSRTVVLLAITLLACLEVVVALAAIFGGDITERAGGILTTVLGSIGTVLAGLLLLLRVESVKEQVESGNAKAEVAADAAAVAARNAATAARTATAIHHDIRNDVLKDRVVEAIKEAGDDPEVQRRRIETVALGVQEDRHTTGSREQAAYARGAADAMKQMRGEAAGGS